MAFAACAAITLFLLSSLLAVKLFLTTEELKATKLLRDFDRGNYNALALELSEARAEFAAKERKRDEYLLSLAPPPTSPPSEPQPLIHATNGGLRLSSKVPWVYDDAPEMAQELPGPDPNRASKEFAVDESILAPHTLVAKGHHTMGTIKLPCNPNRPIPETNLKRDAMFRACAGEGE